jgi:3-oxoacyl-[acyl-carrier protein] reductase/meso-butanediol dehydrogenase/(S,S)-butanediol dehydrogenase/diacetyl reductase
MTELEGKVAIVTGAGRMRSIGRSTALAMARKGANMVITGTGRDPSTFIPDEKAAGWRDIQSVKEEVEALGRRCLAMVVDVTREQQVQAMVDRTLAEFGRIDFLVNNAAYAVAGDRVPVVELSEDLWHKVLEVKLTGVFLCSRAVARVLISQKQGGSIVNLSSAAGKIGTANAAAYSAANGGVQLFTMSLARELGPHGITVNAVCPGSFDTSRNDAKGSDTAVKVPRPSVESIPLRRRGHPDEIGEFIAWLCTPTASYITGQSLNFNGGRVMEH